MRQLDVECLQLTGHIPDGLWNIQTLEWALLSANNFTGELSKQIINAKNLKELRLSNNKISGNIPDEFYQLFNLKCFRIGNSDTYNNIVMDIEKQWNTISGDISKNISNLKNLSEYDISNNNITGEFPEYFAVNPQMYGYVPCLFGNRMSGNISETILSSENWKSWNNPDFFILSQQEGYGFTLYHYNSTDFSKDGEVKTLQKATTGKGIDIVMMGDAFSDRLVSNGTYEKVMKSAMEAFFSEEPYKSHKGA